MTFVSILLGGCGVYMGMTPERDIAQIRRELRERLMAERPEGSKGLLESLADLARSNAALRDEHTRWALRFELLSRAKVRPAVLSTDSYCGSVIVSCRA